MLGCGVSDSWIETKKGIYNYLFSDKKTAISKENKKFFAKKIVDSNTYLIIDGERIKEFCT